VTKHVKQFISEARNESGKYGDRLWVEVNGLSSIYILKLSRVTFNTDEESDDLLHLHYCGYVGIPKSNPLYRKISNFGGHVTSMEKAHTLEVLDIYAHGGITFTGHMKEWDKDYFFIGFDCAHMGDASGIKEIEVGNTFKSWDYVKKELDSLYKNLSKFESESFVYNMMKKEDEL
jgi:hypothetical protein